MFGWECVKAGSLLLGCRTGRQNENPQGLGNWAAVSHRSQHRGVCPANAGNHLKLVGYHHIIHYCHSPSTFKSADPIGPCDRLGKYPDQYQPRLSMPCELRIHDHRSQPKHRHGIVKVRYWCGDSPFMAPEPSFRPCLDSASAHSQWKPTYAMAMVVSQVLSVQWLANACINLIHSGAFWDNIVRQQAGPEVAANVLGGVRPSKPTNTSVLVCADPPHTPVVSVVQRYEELDPGFAKFGT